MQQNTGLEYLDSFLPIKVVVTNEGGDAPFEILKPVLMASDLSKLTYAVDLSRRAMQIVRQNLTFSLAVIGVLIVSTFLNVISLPLGVVGHEGSTVVVVLNGLRLLRGQP